MDLRSLLPSNMLSPHEVLPLLFLLHPPPRDLRVTLFKTWPRRSSVPTTPASASYVIDVLIAVIDSEISFVRLRRKKDKIESEKGEEKKRARKRERSIDTKGAKLASFIRVSKRRFIFRDFFLVSEFGRMNGLLSSRRSRSFVRSLRETKRERGSRSDRETRRTTRDWKQKKKNAAGNVGRGVRRTRRFEETQKVEGRRQGREGV